jgi:hypothetical protein
LADFFSSSMIRALQDTTIWKWVCFWNDASPEDANDALQFVQVKHLEVKTWQTALAYKQRVQICDFKGYSLEHLFGWRTGGGSEFEFTVTLCWARRFVTHILNILHMLSAHGIVHNDLYARNIVVKPNAREWEDLRLRVSLPVLIDFGQAEWTSPRDARRRNRMDFRHFISKFQLDSLVRPSSLSHTLHTNVPIDTVRQ